MVNPSDTRWMAHERCVRAIKASYGTIVTVLDDIHESTHEPEAFGLSNALSKPSTVAAMYMLDYVLPQVAKLSKILQTEHLDLSMISSLVDATLNTLDDTVLPSANQLTGWVLELLDDCECLQEVAVINTTMDDITTFQDQATKPFIAQLKEKISSRFTSSSEVVSAMSIFDPRKAPKKDSHAECQCGEEAIHTLLAHYSDKKPAMTLGGKPTYRESVITSDIITEWKTYRQLLINKPEDSLTNQLKELVCNDMMKTLFLNLHTIARISLSYQYQLHLWKEAFRK